MSADRQTLLVYAAEAVRYEALDISEAQDAAVREFVSLLPKGAEVLDLGAGPGIQASAMAEAGLRVTCWDASPEFVAAARARGLNSDVRLFAELEAENAYDGIFASFSLLHAPRADFPGHLARIARALRPGGLFFLGLKLGEGEMRDRLGRFYTYFTETELRAALDGAGFTIISAVSDRGRGLDGSRSDYILILAHG